MLAKYMRRMRNNNLEIRIVGSSCPGGGGASHMKQTGMLVGNFEFNP